MSATTVPDSHRDLLESDVAVMATVGPDGRPQLSAVDRSAPTRYLEVRGDAELKEDTDYAFAERVGAKYQVDLRSFDGDRPGRVVVTIRPTRINAVNMLAES